MHQRSHSRCPARSSSLSVASAPQLVERTSRAVALTEAGTVLLREGRAALDAVDAAARRVTTVIA